MFAQSPAHLDENPFTCICLSVIMDASAIQISEEIKQSYL